MKIRLLLPLLVAWASASFAADIEVGSPYNYDSLPSHVSHAIGIEHQDSVFYHEFKFGQDEAAVANDTVDTATGVYAFYPSIAVALDIVSDDVDDDGDPADTGCRTAQILGLDENYDQRSEIVTLNGTTAVDLANTYVSVYRVKCLTAGSTGNNEGTLILAVDDASCGCGLADNIGAAHVTALHGQTSMSQYKIPAGYCGAVSDTVLASDGATEMHLQVRPFSGAWALKQHAIVDSYTTSPSEFVTILEPKSDIKVLTHKDPGSAISIGVQYTLYMWAKDGRPCSPLMPALD